MDQKPRILVADDELDILETLIFTLQQEGYEVSSAKDGEEALRRARELEPDLILLDVMMPKENGYRVSKILKEEMAAEKLSKDIKIVLLTARDLSGDAEREEMFMKFSQADEILYKPFELEELVHRIGAILGGSKEPEKPAG